jgi:fructosamine-3-kinase
MADGTFVKTNSHAPPGFYEVEAAGLRWLRVPDGVAVVEPLDVSPGRLVLPRLPTVAPDLDAAERFGRMLTVTHDAGADWFGIPPDGWSENGFIGSAPMPHVHEPGLSWGEFYAEYRVRHFVRIARDRGVIGAEETSVFERVCARLQEGAYDAGSEPPSRIHGDLWSGNVVWATDGVHLIDPAAHGGHRETDLAMLALFGLPFLEPVLAAYDEVRPLADGWRDRVALHQLHPLLVHVVLFGGGYTAQALAAARCYAT